jgi:hypothetical protein
MQQALAVTAGAALVGAVVAAILFFAGVAPRHVAPVAFVLGSIALAAGMPALIEQLGRWGVPGDHS